MNLPRLFLPMPSYWVRSLDMTDWYVTEIPRGAKRVLWDGGLSRDFPRPVWDWGGKPGTGLFDERGYPVDVPDSFLNELPCMPLDGYLHTRGGELVLSVVGLPTSGQFLDCGDVLAGDRIFTLDADGVFDLCMTSPVGSEWRQASDDLVFTNEMFHAVETLTGSAAETSLFRRVGSEDKYNHSTRGHLLFRAPGSTWVCGSTTSWVEINDQVDFKMATVTRVVGQKIGTTAGGFDYYYPGPVPVVGQDVLTFLNRFGFVVGLEPIW